MTGTLTGWLVDVSRSSAAFTVRNLAAHTVTSRVPIVEAVVAVDGEGRPAAVRAVLDPADLPRPRAHRRPVRSPAECPRLVDADGTDLRVINNTHDLKFSADWG